MRRSADSTRRWVGRGNAAMAALFAAACLAGEDAEKKIARKPDYPIAIWLFADDRSYRDGAKRLFGDTRVSHFGDFRPWDQTMVMNVGTGTGTLVHELTHALLKPDFPDCPAWFEEGLASLHEQCQLLPTSIRGLVNWRLPELEGEWVAWVKTLRFPER